MDFSIRPLSGTLKIFVNEKLKDSHTIFIGQKEVKDASLFPKERTTSQEYSRHSYKQNSLNQTSQDLSIKYFSFHVSYKCEPISFKAGKLCLYKPHSSPSKHIHTYSLTYFSSRAFYILLKLSNHCFCPFYDLLLIIQLEQKTYPYLYLWIEEFDYRTCTRFGKP